MILGLVVPNRQAAEQKLPDSWKDSIFNSPVAELETRKA